MSLRISSGQIGFLGAEQSRRRRAYETILKTVVGFFLALGFLVAGVASADDSVDRVPGEYLVKYRSEPQVAYWSLKATPAVQVLDHNEDGHLFKVGLDPVLEARALVDILHNPNVEYVVPNLLLHAYLKAPKSGSQKAMQSQWAIKQVNAQKAWQTAGNKGSRKVLLAVIDTGADYNHPSLKPNMVSGYDFAENDSDPMDKTSSQNPGHGTHCSGIIGGTGLVDGGIYGMSPELSIMPLRFLDEKGSGDLNNGIKAIDYAIKNGAQIISASWGATVPRAQAQPLVDAVQRASDAGVIFVVAAANDGKNNDVTEVYPANSGFDNTIAVAASGPQDEKPSWSNYGPGTVHLASPGLDILSTLPGGKYGNLSGTSMATPLVAGLTAFLKAQDASLTGAQVRALLQLTGAKVNIDVACHCRVDAAAATDAVLAKKMFITPAAGTVAPGGTLKFAGTWGKAPFRFEVADSSIGSINDAGVFTATQKEGQTTVSVTDSAGQKSTSLDIRVAQPKSNGGGGGGGGGGECPIGDPALCQIICRIDPSQPFCQDL